MILSKINQKYPQLKDLRIRSIVAQQSTKTVDCVVSCYDLDSLDAFVKADIVDIIKSLVPKYYQLKYTFVNDEFTPKSFAVYINDVIKHNFGILGNIPLQNIRVVASGEHSFSVNLHINNMQKNIYDNCNFAPKIKDIINLHTSYTAVFSTDVFEIAPNTVANIVADQIKLDKISVGKVINKPSRYIDIDKGAVCYRDKVHGNARYIFDIFKATDHAVICGIVSNKSTKTSTKDPSLKIINLTLTDESGSMDVVIFVRTKPTDSQAIMTTQEISQEKAERLAVANKRYNDRQAKRLMSVVDGINIVVEGRIVTSEYSGNLEMIANKAMLCRIKPKQNDQYKASPPAKYRYIKPTVYCNNYEQTSLFDTPDVCNSHLKGDVVVLQLTTTGTNVFKDSIVAVGCVKINNGVIVSAMSSLVNPDATVSEEILSQYNINNVDLLYYPTLTELVPDIYKFCYGALLVGLDIDNYINMLQYYADAVHYKFGNPRHSYLQFANKILTDNNLEMLHMRKTLYSNYKIDVPDDTTAIDLAPILAKGLLELMK